MEGLLDLLHIGQGMVGAPGEDIVQGQGDTGSGRRMKPDPLSAPLSLFQLEVDNRMCIESSWSRMLPS